jgi:hypothetical protein
MKSAGMTAGSIKPAIAGISRADAPPLPPDRAFGLTFAGVFTVIAAVVAWKQHENWWVYLGIAAVFGVLAVTVPRVLHPLNVVWMGLGALLHRIVSPLVLGTMFFLMITPIAILMRTRGRDVLQRHFDPGRSTYWQERDPPGPVVSDFPRQF